MNKKGAGRPVSDKPKDHPVTVKLRKVEYDNLKYLANKQGLRMSEVCRSLIVKWIVKSSEE